MISKGSKVNLEQMHSVSIKQNRNKFSVYGQPNCSRKSH